MRSFIIAAVILTAIFGLTFLNTRYVTEKADIMLGVCDKIKNGTPTVSIEELLGIWQDCRDIISLSTHRNDLERAENALFAVVRFESDSGDFMSQLDILISALEHIRASQGFTLENIF